MILFKPEHKEMILSGRKTQTRRVGKKRWKKNSIHQARLNFKESWFAKLKIKEVRREKLGKISKEDAYCEGYNSIREYFKVFRKLNGDIDYDEEIWVIEFEVVETNTDVEESPQ